MKKPCHCPNPLMLTIKQSINKTWMQKEGVNVKNGKIIDFAEKFYAL